MPKLCIGERVKLTPDPDGRMKRGYIIGTASWAGDDGDIQRGWVVELDDGYRDFMGEGTKPSITVFIRLLLVHEDGLTPAAKGE